jgi:predicted polyphosphate/ATP-dependent NAD kinase
MKVGFLVNPYAGSGGRLGKKGSDDIYVENPEIPIRVKRFLNNLPSTLTYFTPRFKMGEIYFTNFSPNVINAGREKSTREDTIASVKIMEELGVDIIVFVGGDGTARDIAGSLQKQIPILGVPAGVKMHSGVFASTPEAAAKILIDFSEGRAKIVKAEVLDIDEEEYRKGIFNIKLYYVVNTVSSRNLLTPGKEEYSYSTDEISEYIIDTMKDDIYYILGPGKTVKDIEEKLGYSPNFLSTDIFLGKKLLLSNASYFDLLKITGELKIVLTPIGGQGFLLGRGNQEIGPAILKKAGKHNIIVISSIEKLRQIECLRIDTGDLEVDSMLQGIYKVIVGYNEFMAIRTCGNT